MPARIVHEDSSAIPIDAVQFAMNPEEMDIAWRDANTFPRMNAAGVKKQALLVPARLPSDRRTACPRRDRRLPDRLLRNPRRSPCLARILSSDRAFQTEVGDVDAVLDRVQAEAETIAIASPASDP